MADASRKMAERFEKSMTRLFLKGHNGQSLHTSISLVLSLVTAIFQVTRKVKETVFVSSALQINSEQKGLLNNDVPFKDYFLARDNAFHTLDIPQPPDSAVALTPHPNS
jgi:hypothetical protein